MLINCPRCGFSQPNDQYCAQCGVDMQSYKPKAEPILKKILQSGMFQILVLLISAVLIGQFIIREDRPQSWVQKITRFQGVTKPINTASQVSVPPTAVSAAKPIAESASSDSNDSELRDLKDQEITIPITTPPAGANAAAGVNPILRKNENAAEIQTPQFRLSYVEVSRENLSKWINDSTNAGLFQNLAAYSAGILTDFRKRNDQTLRTLLTKDVKLAVGQSNATMAVTTEQENSSQIIGLASEFHFQSYGNGVVHGSVLVVRNERQGRSDFPAEFDLPRGAVFFLVGALKSNNFANDKARLTMPPFQILNSVDFMTQKTEFVIIIEPEYK